MPDRWLELMCSNQVEFFPGAGDINGAFLPKRNTTLESKAVSDATKPVSAPIVDVSSPALSDAQEKALLDAQIGEQKETIDHQLHDRPLARMQEQKTVEKVEREKEKSASRTATSSAAPSASDSPSPPDTPLLGTTVPDKVPSPPKLPDAAKPSSFLPANGIGASRFTSKATPVNDDSDSDDSSDDSDDNDVKHETTPKAAIPVGSAEADDTQVDNTDIAVIVLNGDGVPHLEIADEVEEDAAEHDSAEDGDNEDFEEALLTDNDCELDRVLAVLKEVHRRYYDQFATVGGVPVCTVRRACNGADSVSPGDHTRNQGGSAARVSYRFLKCFPARSAAGEVRRICESCAMCC